MNHGSDGQRNKSEEAQKAKQVIDKDTPRDADTPQKASQHEEPRPYRPDANVDNQKSEESRSEPGHNTSGKTAPYSGTQVVKEKRAHKDNIDKKSDEADPQGSE
ncbi:hypothetical protein [Vreelandella populi]|uniref:Uncharacterized protein n=1 Tax=Vreelandella populi TaxID=2498858 RepID=A0A433LBR4_9GAMM|nr:hypothetical protein [Halomonas populi]RUR39124.1 hypothetical protein ELY25_05625 [Halomonas populi]RUR46186.1 hypothetical protein ELY37_09360 [Halomonas populi]RUR53263.1 hypothetical protein ELY40_14720 [Halomonas populi]